jgi:hypothetical protein
LAEEKAKASMAEVNHLQAVVKWFVLQFRHRIFSISNISIVVRSYYSRIQVISVFRFPIISAIELVLALL